MTGGILLDELERKDDALEAKTTADENAAGQAQQGDDELKQELEEIRDLFQAELDKANSADEPMPQELIQELDEIPEEEPEEEGEEEIPDDELCECCGEKRRSKEHGEDYPYCEDCRNLMKANPFNALGIWILVLILAVAGFALGNTAKNAESYTTLIEADTAYLSKRLNDAAVSYQNYFQSLPSKDNYSMKAVKNMAKTMATLGYYNNANSLIETYFSDFQLKMPWNSEYVNITKEYEILTKTSEIINENFSSILNGGEYDYEEEIKKADALIEQYKDNEEYSLTFFEYAKYLVMLVDKQSDEVQLAQLLKIEETDGGKHPWIYLTYLLNTYANMGDTENAKRVFETCLELNVQELALYNYYANAYRFADTVDTDKIFEIADLAKQNYSSAASEPVYYRIYAIAYLLAGDSKSAMENLTSYLQNCNATVADYNLYALCAIAAGDDEAYADAKETLELYGYELGSQVKKCKKGKLTVQQALCRKGGDIV